MDDFEFSIKDEQRKIEINQSVVRKLARNRLFVLLLGPSATGKSTIINEMNSRQSDYNFEYVKPMTTRKNRPGEIDKISIDDKKFDQLEMSNEFVAVNALYGVRYGTPLAGIIRPLSVGNVPILDYPLNNVRVLERPEYDMLKFYIYPKSIREWRARIERSDRNIDGRYELGRIELKSLATHQMVHPDIDISVINAEGSVGDTAKTILNIIDQVTD